MSIEVKAYLNKAHDCLEESQELFSKNYFEGSAIEPIMRFLIVLGHCWKHNKLMQNLIQAVIQNFESFLSKQTFFQKV